MADTMIDQLCEAVSETALMAHMTEFARRIKLSGTPAELESFRYLERTLRDYGYQVMLLQHDAYISLPGRAHVEVDGEKLACITHSFSRPSPAGGARGPVVHVGRGAAADFADRALAGCIVLVDGMATPDVSRRASAAGCLGQLHVSPRELPHEMCISPVWGSPSDETRTLLPSTVVCSLPRSVGERVRARVLAGGPVEATLHAEVDTGWRRTPLLQAELPSPANPAEAPFVLFSGHHDTWHLGVMDNGGANATMLEIARIAAAHREGWRRGLRLCFWSGHSHGRYSGSAWYADARWDELHRRCVAHVNVDSTGARGNVLVEGAPCSAELRALGREAVLARAGQHLGERRMPRAGDQSFWGVGVPSMFMSIGVQSEAEGGGLGWWWHTPEDTLDKIEPELLVRDTRIFLHVIWRLLSDAVLPLDHAQQMRELDGVLAALAADLGERFDLSALRARARRLGDAAAALRGRAATGPEAANRALVAASRALVPAEYTGGDGFAHDPALPQEPWPVLDPVRRLAAATAESDAAKFHAVSAMRARNRMAHALDQALAALGPASASS